MNYWNNLYVVLAENLSLTNSDPVKAQSYFYICLDSITNIKSDNDGFLIATNFVYPIWNNYVDWFTHYTMYNVHIKILARKINEFTINNYNSNLSEWVNNMSWTDGCVPFQWAEWAEDAGYDTSEWIVCS